MALSPQENSRIIEIENKLNIAQLKTDYIVNTNIVLTNLTSNLYSITETVLDDATVTMNSTYLLVAQTNTAENGLYICRGTAPTPTLSRQSAFMSYININNTKISKLNTDYYYLFTTTTPFTLNTTAITATRIDVIETGIRTINNQIELNQTIEISVSGNTPNIISDSGFHIISLPLEIPTPILSAHVSTGYIPYNSPQPSPFTGIVSLFIQLPKNHSKRFLDYSPFIELRLKQSNIKKYKTNFKDKVKITSPANPTGCVAGVTNKYKGANIGNTFYTQPTEMILDQGFILYDHQNQNFATNSLQGSWDALNNAPDLNSISPTVGNYFIVSVSGNTQIGTINSWEVGDKAYGDGNNWQRLRSQFNENGTDRIMRFDFNPHQFFGASYNLPLPFEFPVLQQSWDTKSETFRNRRSIGCNSAFYRQSIRNDQGGIIPTRSKKLIVGVRICCLEPTTSRNLLFSEDSNFIAIEPVLCKTQNPNQNFYYGWTISAAYK
jgi:hypothetical protein